MEKLLSRVILQLQNKSSRLHASPAKWSAWRQRRLKSTSSKGLLGSLASVSPELDGMCHQCLSKRYPKGFPTSQKEIANIIQRHVGAFSVLLSKSELLLNSLSQNRRNILSEYASQLFRASDKLEQRRQEEDSHSNPNQEKSENNKDDDEEEKRKLEFKRSIYAFLAVIIISYLLTPSASDEGAAGIKYISWSEFYHNLLLKGEVKSIYVHYAPDGEGENYAVIEVHDGAIIKGQMKSSSKYIIKIPKGFNFEEKVRQLEDELGMPLKDRIPFKHSYPSSWVMVGIQLAAALLLFLFMRSLFQIFTKGKDGKNVTDMIDMLSGGIRQAKFTRVDVASRGAKAVSFKDVAGLKEPKIEIMEFVNYLTNPHRFKELGAKTPRGALLLGPPGCGKTLLARALATEAKVPFLAMAGSEFVEMIGGVGAARVRSLFKEARNHAPCIIYIDEIDAIGRMRGGSASSRGEDEHTLNQLLVEMDGIGTQEGVIMIAATNRADILDKALLRPGRFDRHIMIDLPTLEEREEIFKVYLDKLKLADSSSVYAKPLSRLTPGMSGADIANICNEAAIHAARDSRKSIVKEDFEYAVERVIAGTAKKTGLLSPTEKKVVAYHESGHALVGWMLKYTDALLRISIVPRTNSALGFAQYLPTDQKLYSQEELFERMCMALGGRAAESLIFNHVSTGAHDDLQRVTKMAYAQIQSFGMNAKIGHLSFPSDEEQSGQRPYSQRLAGTIDEEARILISKAFLHTQAVLQENKDSLHKLATTLLEKEVLDYDDIQDLIGPPPHGKKSMIEAHGWKGIMPDSNGDKPTRKQKKK